MNLLDWLFIVLLSITILSFVFFVWSLVWMYYTKKQSKNISCRNIKKKKLRKKRIRQKKKLERKSHYYLKQSIVLLFVGFLIGGSAFYSRYYQLMHLGEKDSHAIVQSYSLLNTIDEQLTRLDKPEESSKVQSTLSDVSGKLASYGKRSADERLSQDGQNLLNRLYKNMKELGLNLSNQSVQTLNDEETLNGYEADIQRTRSDQKKVFDYFHIDEKVLKQQQ